ADADAIDANDIGIFRQLERLAFRLVGFAQGASQASGVGGGWGAGVLEQVEKAKHNIAGGVLENERAAALPADDQVFGGQSADGLARRALADAAFGSDVD